MNTKTGVPFLTESHFSELYFVIPCFVSSYEKYDSSRARILQHFPFSRTFWQDTTCKLTTLNITP